MNRIVCVGNRYVEADSAGPRVFARLSNCALPADVELLDGGLAGIDLLLLVEGMDRVVFVDSVSGFAPDGAVVLLDRVRAAAMSPRAFDHGAGLAWALNMLPAACDKPPREVVVVGVEGLATDQAIEQAAALSLSWATGQGVEATESSIGGAP